ncbi:hydantoinase/oxoprolinase family protein [Sphingomonas sp. MG17]|uniref:Hydantoinase/oxoprolinase family protein n=1 Tax=Sphingomonas tagetis TaxID=2949092 RepID=A0A9X2HSQ6_9SPHN|nr:hydantoinase/oxoprolinase family protein [Sphingomonas tagetis]MCP3731220.1 hydantoinase/oxoprolinase family protein [Sphingomonas tagetis]
MTLPTTGRRSIAIDIGGTFTDVVLSTPEAVYTEKTLTTHDDLLRGFFTGVESVLVKSGISAAELDGALVHATTVVTNALIERQGAKTAMIFTDGFRDILEIREEKRFDIYDVQIQYPRTLVGPEATYTVRERTLASGEIELAPDRAEVSALARRLTDEGIQSVGVCFLHSYRNPANEQAVATIMREIAPHMDVSVSSEVAPQIREYLRASTTAVNAYAISITKPYLGRLAARLIADGVPAKPSIMLSSGGVVSPDTAGRLPVRMLESGPAAGALGGAFVAQLLNEKELLAFDMGGTTAKVCLIQDGEPLVTNMFEVDRIYRMKEGSGLPVIVPCVDLIEIGAGGGSIAHVDQFGLLKVGPRSAGSMPGPACYGGGGIDATVTDAAAVLGLLDPGNFLGGEMKLDGAAAHAALARLGERLDLPPETVAKGVFDIVCESMAGAVRAHAAERGVDVRGVPMLASGGSGPVHACGVADLLNARKVIFPPLASVLSAFGSIITPVRFDVVRSGLARLDDMDWEAIDTMVRDMEHEGRDALSHAQIGEGDVRYLYSADVRYQGQHHELKVDLPGRPGLDTGAEMIRKMFEDEYRRRHTLIQGDVPVEVVSWRLAATGPTPSAAAFGKDVGTGMKHGRERPVHAWGRAGRRRWSREPTLDPPMRSPAPRSSRSARRPSSSRPAGPRGWRTAAASSPPETFEDAPCSTLSTSSCCGRAYGASSARRPRRCSAPPSARSCARRATSPMPCSIPRRG